MANTPYIYLHDQLKKTVQICHQHNFYRRQVWNNQGNLKDIYCKNYT